MSYDSKKRLEIHRLVEGLGDAVLNDKLNPANSFREQLSFAIEYALTGDPTKPLHDTLRDLLRITGLWVRGVVINDKQEDKKQIQTLVDRAITLLLNKP